MANDFTARVTTAVAPSAAWKLAGDPERIGEWFPPVLEARVDGDERTVVMASGAELVERLVDRDDTALRYSYEVISGIPGLTSHRATISVEAAGDGSEISWRQRATSSVEGYDVEERLGGIMRRGLDRLRDILEGATGE